MVLVLVDDLGWSDLSCYGNQFNESPHIDRLATQGVRFTDFYASCPVCSPTRAALQSGQYQARFDLTNFIPGHWRPYERLVEPENAPHLPLSITTIAEAMKPAGYTCGYFGKWHLGGASHGPEQQGYDTSIVTSGRHFAPHFRTTPNTAVQEGKYLADFLTDQTIEFIQSKRQRPFFVQLSHYAVHIPLEAKEETIAKYRRKPKPDEGVNHPVYAAMVEHVDESVGRIMQTLDALNLSDNTLLIVTSDNGGLRMRYDRRGEIVTTNDPLRDEKGSLYEGGIRVPLIVRWPGVTPEGAVCDEPTVTPDLYTTCVRATGASLPADQRIDGVDLRPILEQPDGSLARDAIYFHYPHYHHSRPASAIRAGEWKLIEFFDGPYRDDGGLELYNLEQDISESNNLADDKPGLAQRLQRQLADWRARVGAKLPTENPKYDPQRRGQWYSRRSEKFLAEIDIGE